MKPLGFKYELLNSTTFVMGNRKNAGKTTFLNWALNQVRKVDQPAFGTIGIDGESNDQIDGRTKPVIHAVKGDAIVTSYPMINKSKGLFSIEKALPINTPLGQLVIAKTIRNGNIELVGPEHNEQLQAVINYLKNELHYQTILIDGAASRLTPVSTINDSGFYYLLNIDRRNIKKALEQMQLLSVCSQFEHIPANKNPYQIEGALTALKLNTIPTGVEAVAINDLTSVFLNFQQLNRLMEHTCVYVKNKLNLKGFVIVLKDVSETDFTSMYKNKNIETPVIFNPYVHN